MENIDIIKIIFNDIEFKILKKILFYYSDCLLTRIICNETTHKLISFKDNIIFINKNSDNFSYLLKYLNGNPIDNSIDNEAKFYNIDITKNNSSDIAELYKNEILKFNIDKQIDEHNDFDDLTIDDITIDDIVIEDEQINYAENIKNIIDLFKKKNVVNNKLDKLDKLEYLADFNNIDNTNNYREQNIIPNEFKELIDIEDSDIELDIDFDIELDDNNDSYLHNSLESFK